MEQAKLPNINPQTTGLYSTNEGGLGTGMWKGTSLRLVERLMPTLDLPSYSPRLNDLARRLFLTTADVPSGEAGKGTSFISLRVNALDELGDAKDAWKLIAAAPAGEINDETLKLTAEDLLPTDASADVCAKLPQIIKDRSKTDWQELQLVCQLQAKDTKAAQLTLDLMRSQNAKDETLYYIAERNIIGGSKELPRQLTPLKPVTLALLQLTGQPLRSEVYARPDAALMPTVLMMKTRDESMRLSLAERAAARGIISASELEAVDASIAFPPQAVVSAVNSNESLIARLHALLYQASQQEKDPAKRIALAIKYLHSARASELNGVQRNVIGDILGNVEPADTYNAVSAQIAHIYILAGNSKAAMEWIKQARHAAIGLGTVAADLQNLWPIEVLSGLEPDADYNQDLGKWLDTALANTDPEDDNRPERERAASILLLLDAAGYAVPEEDWARVITSPTLERHPVPPAILLDQLNAASVANRRGETVLFSLLLSGGSVDDPSFISTLAVIRALRLVGLAPDAAALAREAVTYILTPAARS